MVPRSPAAPDPPNYFLQFTEGLWELSVPRGSKGKRVKVESYRNEVEAIPSAKARAQADPRGAYLRAISTASRVAIIRFEGYRRVRECFEYPAHR
jgi:hypothetical protein